MKEKTKPRPGVKVSLYIRKNGVHYVEAVVLRPTLLVRRPVAIREDSADAVFARLERVRATIDRVHPRRVGAV